MEPVAKAKTFMRCPRGSSRPRPGLENNKTENNVNLHKITIKSKCSLKTRHKQTTGSKLHLFHKSFSPQLDLFAYQMDCTNSSCFSVFLGMSVHLMVLCAELSWPLATSLARIKSQHIITIIVINESESSQQASSISNKEKPQLSTMH